MNMSGSLPSYVFYGVPTYLRRPVPMECCVFSVWLIGWRWEIFRSLLPLMFGWAGEFTNFPVIIVFINHVEAKITPRSFGGDHGVMNDFPLQ